MTDVWHMWMMMVVFELFSSSCIINRGMVRYEGIGGGSGREQKNRLTVRWGGDGERVHEQEVVPVWEVCFLLRRKSDGQQEKTRIRRMLVAVHEEGQCMGC